MTLSIASVKAAAINPIETYFSGVYRSSVFPFSITPSSVSTQQLRDIPEETLEGLWDVRFCDGSPTEFDLILDEFYYALAYRWWNENRLKREYTPTVPAMMVYVRT